MSRAAGADLKALRLLLKVEAAIKLAGKLGSDAFDAVEGGGLRRMREEIADDIAEMVGLDIVPLAGNREGEG